jgi:ATP-binding cassette subfamily F protein 3
VEWLEGYLRQWDGAALIVSHDRYFLDQVANVVLEMSATGIETYRGNYSAYLQQRQERWDLRRQVFEAEKEKLVKDLEYIKKNIAGQNTLQAKGRLRRLSRMLDAIDKAGLLATQGKQWAEIAAETGATAQMMGVEEADRRVHGLHMPSNRPPQLHLKLKSGLRSGDLVLRTYGLAVGYADEGRPLFNCPDLTLKRGECAALIGPNGAGKTTFLKTLLEKLPPLQGEVQLGASLKVAYFAQAHEDLHPERTLAQEIDTVAPQMLLGEIRNYLAKFLFTGEDVFKKVEVLSGGERGRLALAKLALSDANLLLLDEPTNHLDIPSQEILQSVLADYPGTVLLVSHDRYLIDALATQIWEIVPGEAQLRLYAGDYSQYKEELLRQETAAAAGRGAIRQEAAQQRAQAAPAAQPLERKRRQRLQELEKIIAAHETELAELGRRLENPPPEPGRVQILGRDYVRLEKELEQLMAEWVGLSQ